ncbi:A disintegrin and metalloproteinase with thrombospondin motifs 5 [Lingula anatina]|uniref:A disintegrin and metalloproteinase with thrombospondin motifs 5 n=1 Tax=Lingula anatina TaxID=7574 RepID=A0A1S3HEY0_LINAN|nr:A disintegrin and metalloproteinase with thrombospondin motifs 5 [Lingula anatina]|eukprot:XP_013383594.1 A disintegrin and metalloproteinase with thrombospondin motifs 5 [Lingula anatina]
MMADVSKSPGSKKFLCTAIALNLLICYVRCHAGPFPETVDIGGEHILTRLRRAASEDSKEHYILKTSDKEVSLNLKKTSTVNANVPVFVIRNGIPAEIKTDRIENLDFYQDKRHGASLSVRRMREQNVSLVEGTLTIGGREYHLQSAAQRHSREAPHRQSSDDKHIDGALYTLTKIQRQSDYIDDTVGRSPAKLRKHVPYARQRRDTSSKARYGVELMMVVDNAIYTRWYNTTTGHEDRQKAAIEKIRYYFAHVANGVDLRYQSMDEAPFEIYVRLVGLCIATDPMSSIWTESTDIKSDATPRPLVNAKLALRNFTDWINEDSTRNTLPTFDHAMLFTGYDIWNGEDASGNKAVSVAGVAKVGQICKRDRTSINEDHGGFACIGVSSHEMGHNLGAVHDGDNNTCNGSQQYIMAAVSDGNAPLSALRNAFTFSKCSVEAFRQKISELNSEENCLNNTAKPENETSWEDYMKTFPGQKYPPDAQCRQLYGPQSYYCGGEKADSEICARMSCYSPVDGTCIQGGGIHAARGTTCGNKKTSTE